MAGLISGIAAMAALNRMKHGRKAKLSPAQITYMIVNLPDAQKNLSEEQFSAVYSQYKQF